MPAHNINNIAGTNPADSNVSGIATNPNTAE